MCPTENEAALHRGVGKEGFFPSQGEHTAQALFCTSLKETKPCTVSATRYEVITLKVITFVDYNAKSALSKN